MEPERIDLVQVELARDFRIYGPSNLEECYYCFLGVGLVAHPELRKDFAQGGWHLDPAGHLQALVVGPEGRPIQFDGCKSI